MPRIKHPDEVQLPELPEKDDLGEPLPDGSWSAGRPRISLSGAGRLSIAIWSSLHVESPLTAARSRSYARAELPPSRITMPNLRK